jgi:GxxExxY protein
VSAALLLAHIHAMETRDLNSAEARLTHSIIGAALTVHREFGPGLLESAYEECLAYELGERGHLFERQPERPVYTEASNFNSVVLARGIKRVVL